MNVLVTGGSGFIGRQLIKELIRRCHNVTNFDIVDCPSLEGSIRYRHVYGSVANVADIGDVLDEGHFDYIFHLAAVAGIEPGRMPLPLPGP